MKQANKWNYFFVSPHERAWFIRYDGKKLANDTGHKQLLKDNFPEDWKIFVREFSQENNRDENDPLVEAEAERTFTYRLLKTGWVKIVETEGAFYLDFCHSYAEMSNITKKFTASILKVRNGIENKEFNSGNIHTGNRISHTVSFWSGLPVKPNKPIFPLRIRR